MKVIPPILLGFAILFVGIYVSGRLALYEDFPYFDSLMHVLGGATIAWVILAYAQQRGYSRPSLKKVLTITIVIGLLWELAEYVSGVTLKGTIIYKYYHGGDRLDTFFDVLMDALGALSVYGLSRLLSNSLQRSDS